MGKKAPKESKSQFAACIFALVVIALLSCESQNPVKQAELVPFGDGTVIPRDGTADTSTTDIQDSSSAQIGMTTGIIGQVFRGPVDPVCYVDQPCIVFIPFQATFYLIDANDDSLTFTTGPEGDFQLPTDPGDYVIVPNANAPVFFPAIQRKYVTVPDSTVITVRLEFDTGIL